MTVKFSDLYRQWPVSGLFHGMVVFHEDPFGRVTHNTHRWQISLLEDLGYGSLEKGTLVWFKKGETGVAFLTPVAEAEAILAQGIMEKTNG